MPRGCMPPVAATSQESLAVTCFFSKELEAAQQKYSAFDRELFSCYLGIRHFLYMLDGRPFTVLTDHKLFTYTSLQVSDPWIATSAGSCPMWQNLYQSPQTIKKLSLYRAVFSTFL